MCGMSVPDFLLSLSPSLFLFVCKRLCVFVCVCVCVFIKLHIAAQSGPPVILVILCHSH